MTEKIAWHVITPEFPPQIGGVADYSNLIAEELIRQGETVFVWPPREAPMEGRFDRKALRRLSAALDGTALPRRLFVQWVPHGYGYRAMNLGFCFWLHSRFRRGDRVDLMIHEAFLSFGEGSWKQDAVAAVHRLMMVILLRSASRVWVSIPRWESRIRPWLLGRKVPIEWLPVPSNIPVCGAGPAPVAPRFSGSAALVGSFGTFGSESRAFLEAFVPHFLRRTGANLLLMGRDSDSMAARFAHPRILGTGALAPEELSRSIAACDLLWQPYTDGVSTRRSSAMAALAHGKALLTTAGIATEAIWKQTGAAFLVDVGGKSTGEIAPDFAEACLELLAHPETRVELGERGRNLYLDRFQAPIVAQKLRQADRGSHG